jgi:hypothetical protein
MWALKDDILCLAEGGIHGDDSRVFQLGASEDLVDNIELPDAKPEGLDLRC